MPIIITATIADAAPILALQKRAYAAEARLYEDQAIPPLTQTLASLQQEIETITVLKATENDVIVGSVRAHLDGQVCKIGRLIVEPARQGRGIGSALLCAVERSFSAAIVFELFTGSKSESNIRLYRRHGYQVTRTTPLSERVTLVVMNKMAPAGGEQP